MSPDLDRMFSALQADASRVGLPAPDGLRERGNQRTRRRAIASLVAIAVLAGGVSIGARQLLAGPVAPAPQPGQTVTPWPSPTAAPASEEPYPAGSPLPMPAGCEDVLVYPYDGPAPAGQALPASVMLRAGDWGKCHAMVGDHAGYPAWERGKLPEPQPDLCFGDEPYRADADRVAGRFRQFAGGPEVYGFESVTRYRAGGAEAFLAEVRDRVARCATFTSPDQTGDATWRAQVAERDFTGDESLLVYVGTGTAAKPSYPGWWVGVARVGDLVIVVEPVSDLGGSRAFAKTMTGKAVQRAT
ncbi:hypothetical protein [Micromonospora sp. NPDC051296]|uniref:hypothetical protein n=1 Tax=Micromonospora sp. NPDC051296 TaxID=3155046 RepID=UPI003440BEA6